MDVIYPDNSQYFCSKCEMYIQISLQPIHSTFCQGISSQDIHIYSDIQVYELSRMMHDQNMLEMFAQDSRTNFNTPGLNYDDYIPEDINYIDPQNSVNPTSQNSQLQSQPSSTLQQQNRQMNANQASQGGALCYQNSRYQYFVQDSTFSKQSSSLSNQNNNNNCSSNNNNNNNNSSSSALRNQQMSNPQRLGQAISNQYKTPSSQFGNTPNLIKQGTSQQNNEDNLEETYQCPQCSDYVKISDYSIHQEECRNQNIKCKYCHSFFPYNLINQHIRFCEQDGNVISQQSSLRSFRRNQFNNSPIKQSGYDSEEIEESRDIDEHNSCENNNSVYDNLSLYGQQFNMEERSLANRQRQNNTHQQNSTIYLQSQQSQVSNTHLSTENNQNQEFEYWATLSPDNFQRALNIIFPSFIGEQDDFRRQQNELFRNNLITRLINISRYGLSAENNRGLSKSQKSQFIKVQYKAKQQKEYKTCSICMCDFEEDEDINILDCMHRYHVECISKWFQARTTCPICKKDMSEYMQ